ncbi:PspC domain-containing protein [Isoptericola sp. 178]|uniref:PspC domain-containing protein n=1 Tax=Isoptericola sp. 178 TaxID=3064651 RepID=UPI0027128550|nr:PspC domain-containing protein [Isoptericola sp. 178]MDO8143100.1 PspC domain-containing protein [Isoptericola sp. 178]
MTTNDTPPPSGGPGPGDTGPGTPPPPPRPAGDGFFDSLRRTGVTRAEDRWVGGVAAGVAHRFGLDPLLVRGLLILSFFVTGAGLVLYGAAWLLLPEASDGRIHLQEAIRGRFDVAVLGAGLTIVAGIGWGGGIWPWWDGFPEWIAVLFWIGFWVAVVWLIVKLVRSRQQGGAAPPAAPAAPAAPAEAAPRPSAAPGPSPAPFEPAPRVSYASAPPAAPAPRTPAPTTPAVRAAGGGTIGVVVGLALLAGAALLAADIVLGLTMPVWGLWLGTTVAIVGAALVVTGLRGRRGGWLTAFAVLGLVATLVTWPFADRHTWWDEWPWDDGRGVTTSSGTTVSSGMVTPRSVAAAEEGVRVQFGEAWVDLTELDLTDVEPGSPVEVPIEMTAGRTVVEIPADAAVVASVDVSAGRFVWDVDGEYRTVDGFSGGPTTYTSDEASEAGGPVLLLDVDARAGEIVIQEDR